VESKVDEIGVDVINVRMLVDGADSTNHPLEMTIQD
jgi:hypothetical protein